MGQALYRKYRSRSLGEIVGQEHITTALATAIKTGRVSHAYLFTGPRGIGKTSIARILAHEINGLPYSTDPHLDIIEIDAASNRRIDEIRDLRDKVYIAPTSAKYKVYIIDEVHMLTREAFNALLKTLEEPPEHVVFILATTDAHKLPETIISRTQRYNFRPVETAKVAEHLAFIAKQEKIKAEAEALTLLAQHGEGSFRDSISMLDQVSNDGKGVTLEGVRLQLGIPPDEAITHLLASLTSGDIAAPVIALQSLYDGGYRATTIAEQLAKQLRNNLTGGSLAMPNAKALELLKELLNVAGAVSPERFLEITLMEATAPAGAVAPVVTTASVATPVPQPIASKPVVHQPVTTTTPVATQAPAVVKKATPQPSPEPTTPAIVLPENVVPLNDDTWPNVLGELKKQYNTLYGIVRMARTDFSEPGKVTLEFAFPFHQKRISDLKNRQIVSDCIAVATGQQVELVCLVNPDAKPKPLQPAAFETPVVAPAAGTPVPVPTDISNIFGGGEVLPS